MIDFLTSPIIQWLGLPGLTSLLLLFIILILIFKD